jgi:hypothetical protein
VVGLGHLPHHEVLQLVEADGHLGLEVAVALVVEAHNLLEPHPQRLHARLLVAAGGAHAAVEGRAAAGDALVGLFRREGLLNGDFLAFAGGRLVGRRVDGRQVAFLRGVERLERLITQQVGDIPAVITRKGHQINYITELHSGSWQALLIASQSIVT